MGHSTAGQRANEAWTNNWVRAARANSRAADLAPVVKALQAAGITSLNGIAAALNERRYRFRGC
jgi:hypothetical protein